MNSENANVPQSVIDDMKAKIASFRQSAAMLNKAADDTEFALQKMLDDPPPKVYFFEANPKISRKFARMFLQQIKKPVRTAEIIEMTYRDADEKTKAKAIKTLSVVLNVLAQEGEITVANISGVKGNYYTWIEK
jgi:hypothetical protein